jgi:hypothetical protein
MSCDLPIVLDALDWLDLGQDEDRSRPIQTRRLAKAVMLGALFQEARFCHSRQRV